MVHSRWRGEHENGELNVDSVDGSSPLARGTPVIRTPPLEWTRFIPAGAGNTHALQFVVWC